jgi:hypothetical protein
LYKRAISIKVNRHQQIVCGKKEVFLKLYALIRLALINLFGISAPILGNLNIILTNISLKGVLIIITVISMGIFGSNFAYLVDLALILALIFDFEKFFSSFVFDNTMFFEFAVPVLQMGAQLSISSSQDTRSGKSPEIDLEAQNNTKNSIESDASLSRPHSSNSIEMEVLDIRQDKGKGKATENLEEDKTDTETNTDTETETNIRQDKGKGKATENLEEDKTDTETNTDTNTNTDTETDKEQALDFTEGSSSDTASCVSMTTRMLPNAPNNTPEPWFKSDNHPTNNPEDYRPRVTETLYHPPYFREVDTPEPEGGCGCCTGVLDTIKETIKDLFN